jgi:hypothetical protein
VGVCFSLLLVVFVSGVCLSIYYISLTCLFWVCWVRENFSGGPGHIFPVWDSAVWSAGPVQFNLSTLLEWMAGLYRFSLLWLCCNGYGTVEMVGGWSVFFSIFSLLFIFGGRLCVVGLHFLKLVLFGSFLVLLVDFVFYKLLSFSIFVTGGIGRVGTWRTRSLCWSRRSWSTEGWTSRLALRSWSPMCGI